MAFALEELLPAVTEPEIEEREMPSAPVQVPSSAVRETNEWLAAIPDMPFEEALEVPDALSFEDMEQTLFGAEETLAGEESDLFAPEQTFAADNEVSEARESGAEFDTAAADQEIGFDAGDIPAWMADLEPVQLDATPASVGSSDDLLDQPYDPFDGGSDALEREVRAGVTTKTLDDVAAAVVARRGARSAPAFTYGFPGTVLISVNDEVVHGIPGPRRLAAGDIVKLDVTLDKDGYVADAARTVVVAAGTDQALRLADCAKAAFDAALHVARAGTRVNEIGRVVEREVRRRGFNVVRGLDGHGIGRTIHEAPPVPNYYNPMQRDVLTEGMVITIEPIIAAGSGAAIESGDGWTVVTTDGSLAAHYEHTLVITRERPVLLTAA